jgi:ubiquinone/menaquinone biosynthesis C-methylase UbiE
MDNMMRELLKGGIPTERNYEIFLRSKEFYDIEEFSNRFLSQFEADLRYYARKWVKDPLHNWSRQWEYPFVLSRLQSNMKMDEAVRVLDAGSGVTFFPYYLKNKNNFLDINCCDSDESLENIFKKINNQSQNKIDFSCSDLKKTIFKDNFFDVVYCISVLEHTQNYIEIIDEFYRIIKPGGKLIITFDVSIDEKFDINLEEGERFLEVLTKKFDNEEYLPIDLHSQVLVTDIFTTLIAEKKDVKLLPWKRPSIASTIKSILIGNAIGNWPPLFTVFCISLLKPIN